MKAWIVAVGSELLGTDRLDTNSLLLTRGLLEHGHELVGKSVAPDDESTIAAVLDRALEDADVVIVTGGLGPTRDDRTRDAVGALLQREVFVDEELWRSIQEGFRRIGREIPAVNRKQAETLAGAVVLTNRAGVAPGLLVETERGSVFLLPGVPREVEAIYDDHLLPWLVERADRDGGFDQVELRIACLPESLVEEEIAPVYEAFGADAVSVLARPGEIRLRLRASGPADGRTAQLEAMSAAVIEILGDAVFDRGEGLELEAALGRLLASHEDTVAVAESCTGGLLGQRLTSVAGSSTFFLGGITAYANAVKAAQLDVPRDVLDRFGAVSKETAAAMAKGVRERLGASWGISTTGIAGPGGGTDAKPVGTVFLGLAGKHGAEVAHATLPGDRERVRRLTSQLAFELLRRRLLDPTGEITLPWTNATYRL